MKPSKIKNRRALTTMMAAMALIANVCPASPQSNIMGDIRSCEDVMHLPLGIIASQLCHRHYPLTEQCQAQAIALRRQCVQKLEAEEAQRKAEEAQREAQRKEQVAIAEREYDSKVNKLIAQETDAGYKANTARKLRA
jgi:hypothetical protein